MTEQLRTHTHASLCTLLWRRRFFPVLDPALEAELEAGILVQFVEGTLWGFPGSSVGKESTCSAGDPGLVPELGRSAGEGIGYPLHYSWASLVAQLVKNLPAMRETWVLFLGWEDPWRRERLPTLQYSGLENSMDCIVHGVTKSQTLLSGFHFPLGWST